MAAVISATAPNCTPSHSHRGSSRLSRASVAMPSPPPPSALAKKDVQDRLFKEEEFQALMSGQCELLSFSDNDLQSSPPPPPLLSLQLQAQLLCRDDAYAWVPETPPSPPLALDDLDLEAPISDADIEQLASLFSDEEIQALCAASAPRRASMQFSRPRSGDHQAGRKRMSSSSWPSCIADDDGGEVEAGPPPPTLPPPTKNARTKTKSTSRFRREHEPPPRPPPAKKARTHTKSRCRPEHAAARADLLRRRLRILQKKIATRILTRQFRAPELSRGRTALRCQCPELAGFGLCALHQDALPGDRAWMHSGQGHAPPLVGGPGEVLVPAASAGSSKAMVRQYARWRRTVSLPSRFYVEQAAEKRLAQQPDDETMQLARAATVDWRRRAEL